MNRSCLLTLAFAFGLCAWLGADTKPTPPTPEAGAKRMMTVDGAKQTLYPKAAQYELNAAALKAALERLNQSEADASAIVTLLDTLEEKVGTLESEVTP